MSWKLLSKPEIVRLTKKLATQFAQMDAVPEERSLSSRRLEVYRKIAKDGNFRPIQWAKANCIETSGLYRINGQHTSNLFANWEGDLPELYVTLEHFSCDRMEDVSRLYGSYDNKIQSRTVSEINMAFAAVVPGLADISHRTINTCVAAMAYYKSEDYHSRTQPADRAESLFEHPEFVQWVDSIVGGRREATAPLVRVPVFSCMFGCYQKSKSAAETFWTEVRDGSNEDPNSPSRKLQLYLIRNHSVNSRTDKPRRYKIQPREFYVKCIHAWNAWRRNENTNLNYKSDSPIPSFR